MTLNMEEQEAVAVLCLMAAFADGKKEETERDRLKEIFDSLGTDFSPVLYRQVLMKQVSLEEASLAIETPELRQLAYEMAVGVCDADGITNIEERLFLDNLGHALQLKKEVANAIDQDGETLASIPLQGDDPASLAPMPLDQAHTSSDSNDLGGASGDQRFDSMILKYSILNGGLELLPQSLASMAIVPLQMKMVYRIGQGYGFQLDQGHIREFLAIVGVGMTSQVLETYARKLVGGLVKKSMGKKKGKKLAKAVGTATGAAMSFATTYALGQVARLYYSSGRSLDSVSLKQLYSEQIEKGKMLYTSHRSDVEASARSIDLNSLLSMVRKPAF